MVITVPTAHMKIESDPQNLVCVTENEPLPYVLFEENEFVSNVVYVEFARGPPQENRKVV